MTTYNCEKCGECSMQVLDSEGLGTSTKRDFFSNLKQQLFDKGIIRVVKESTPFFRSPSSVLVKLSCESCGYEEEVPADSDKIPQ